MELSQQPVEAVYLVLSTADNVLLKTNVRTAMNPSTCTKDTACQCVQVAFIL